MPVGYIQLESGEKIYAPDSEKVAAVLDALHPEFNSKALFYNAEGEMLIVDGSVSGGFLVQYEQPIGKNLLFTRNMLSLSDALLLIKRFLEREKDWQTGITWKSMSRKAVRRLQTGLGLLVAAIILWILTSFFKDILKWF